MLPQVAQKNTNLLLKWPGTHDNLVRLPHVQEKPGVEKIVLASERVAKDCGWKDSESLPKKQFILINLDSADKKQLQFLFLFFVVAFLHLKVTFVN